MNVSIGIAAVTLACAAAVVAGPAVADPAPPYPDFSRFAKLDFEGFKIADKPGVWFSTPLGLNCGIWDDSSFGCTGVIPGAPGGANQVGWFSGDRAPHFDNTGQPRFSAGPAQRVLPPGDYIEYAGVRCGTAPDNAAFCQRDYLNKILVTPTQSWIGGGYS